MDAEGTGIPPAAAASRVSLEAEDYGLTEGMLRMETSPECPSLSVEALGAFFLHTDGAGAESASYWLYRRFLEDPESVLEYLNRVRGLRPSGNASPEGTAEQILSRAIVFSHSPGDGYEETLRRCREEFPQPPFSELLELLEPRDTPGN